VGISNEEESFPLLSREGKRRGRRWDGWKTKRTKRRENKREGRGGSDKCGKGRLHKV